MRRGAWLFLVGAVAVACGGRAESSSSGGGGGSGGSGDTTASGGSGNTASGGSGNTASGGTGGGVADAGPLDASYPDVKPPAGQNILFEVSQENYAWGATLTGVFITADGNLYSYDYFASSDAGWGPAVLFPATEDELRSRYGTPTLTGSVPLDELMAHFAMVEPAASGVLLKDYSCADAGSTSYLGYLYDAATAEYTRVILGIDGDMAAQNTAPAAAELVRWLSQFVGSRFCEFMGVQCSGEVCATLPPSCPDGQVPSVENGCWGGCVAVTRCLDVPDCSVCTGGAIACATSASGTHHCLPMYCANADLCACEQYPPCAGGAGYCTNSASFQVTCGP